MILILSQPDDGHAAVVTKLLERRSAPYAWIDPGAFTAEAEVSASLSPGREIRRTWHGRERHVDLDAVSVAWYRRPTPVQADGRLSDEECRGYATTEKRAVLGDLWESLPCRWIPGPPSVLRRAELKLFQLTVARALGFELPPTLITSSPRDFFAFYREHDGRVISKLPSSGAFINGPLGHRFRRFTEPVRHRDLAHAESLRTSPMIFQAYVEKRLELRVTVVGDRIFAAAIHSQATRQTRLDWRRYDPSHTPYTPFEIPPALAAQCVALLRRLGLSYGAVDLILTPDERFVFLEINPNGQFLWVERATGLPISEAICDALVDGAPVPATRGPLPIEGSRHDVD
jgi:glutathione synthase/RimK-type ligase-like ATP-grasp enzyme